MAWKYKYPLPNQYDTFEEYEEACESYEWAEDQYIDDYIERCYEERHKTDN